MGFLRGLLAVVAGIVFGSIFNMGLIMIGGKVIAPPVGADVMTLEGLTASMHLFEPKHFLFPFLAHAVGTLVGALVASMIPGRKFLCAMIVGCFFLLGGIANVVMLPAPLWFEVTDLVLAYLPMAWLGHRLVAGRAGRQA